MNNVIRYNYVSPAVFSLLNILLALLRLYELICLLYLSKFLSLFLSDSFIIYSCCVVKPGNPYDFRKIL